MAFLSSFDISGYGLSAQRQRINLINSNIANAQTTRTSEGGPYKRKMLVFKAFDFNKVINANLKEQNRLHKYEDPLELRELGKQVKTPIMSVYVDKIVRDDTAPKLRYEPSHPDANAEGYVAYPNINPVIEMADLIEATRSYQANIAAFEGSKTIANAAIDILRA